MFLVLGNSYVYGGFEKVNLFVLLRAIRMTYFFGFCNYEMIFFKISFTITTMFLLVINIPGGAEDTCVEN